MRILYFDAFSGASGDMILGALVDLGADYAGLRTALGPLARGRFALRRRKVFASALEATKIDVRVVSPDEPERNFREIASVIRRGGLAAPVRDLALEIFRRLCKAEGEAHGQPFEKVHLHEAGAIDAIADVCGAAWLIDSLRPDRVLCSPLNVGSGTLECRHGTYPVPGPATARLLRGVPVYAEGEPGERVTPTGAAILSTVVSEFRALPPIVPRAVGHGAGCRVFVDRPNVLRAILGDGFSLGPARDGEAAAASLPALPAIPAIPDGPGDVFVIETTIDDMNPQNYGFLLDRALAEGAREVFFTPVLMKKGRPGVHVTAIVEPERFEAVSRLIFRESTTIGFRFRREARRELAREVVTAETPYGRVRLKVSSDRGEVLQIQPEFEDCRRLADASGIPLKEVQRAALGAWKPPRRRKVSVPARGGRTVAARRYGSRTSSPPRDRG